jgi:hypothetical protein
MYIVSNKRTWKRDPWSLLYNLQNTGFTSHYPFDIKNDKVYQVLENEDTEGWDLHVTEVN